MKIRTRKWLGALQLISSTCALFCLTPAHAQVDIRIAGVYGAQSHVIDLNDQYYDSLDHEQNSIRVPFPMLADRDMLFKVNLIEVPGFSEGEDLPESTDLEVTVTLGLDGESTKLTLDPPLFTDLPTEFATNPANLVHTFEDSYTINIPKKWMKPGLTWQLGWCHSPGEFVHCELKEEKPLQVRPPIKMTINVFPFEHFGWSWSDNSVDIDSMFEEMAQKLPVSELVIRKPETDYYQVNQRLIPGQGGAAKTRWRPEKIGSPPRIIDSPDGNGLGWLTQVLESTAWNNALVEAAGLEYNTYTASYMLMGLKQRESKGKGAKNGMTSTVMNRGANYGVAWHESLHMYDLAHVGTKIKGGHVGTAYYPYIGELDGIPPASDDNAAHIGPTWGYDSRFKIFLSPLKTEPTSGFTHWRTAPEKAGNRDTHWDVHNALNRFVRMTPLSDWSAAKVMDMWGSRPAWFDATKDSYWVDKSGWYRYNNVQNKFVPATVSERRKGFTVPREDWPGTRVYSILMQASTATEFYNIKNGSKVKDIERLAMVYPPIGPYKTNVQFRIDPTNGGNRNWALRRGMCDEVNSFCDFSVRVKRNGIWKVYVLDRKSDWNADTPAWGRGEFSGESFVTVAINLPINEGEIEEAQLLLTPNVLQTPWPYEPEVLATWQR